MTKRIALTGNEAMALVMKQINPDVVAAYPITPQTEIVQIFSQFVADGEIDTEFVTVESEHSAMSAVIGASAAGARAMTATSANGLALMWEVVYIAASCRLPIVMAVVNRALSGPINIHCDHSDAMGMRDSGWIQLFGENAQEAYDNALMAVRIAEHKDVMLPVAVNMDGFIISHAVENIEIVANEDVRDFVGEYNPERYLLDVQNPITVGPVDLQDFYFEHKRQQVEAMKKAKNVIQKIADEFVNLTGRKYSFFEEYYLDDAEIALVAMGSAAGTAKAAIDELREQGIKVGLLKLRVFRPFPAEEIVRALSHIKVVGVMDRAESFNTMGGPLFSDMRSAMYDGEANVRMINIIYGLGGRDITVTDIKNIIQKVKDVNNTGKIENLVIHYGVRE
ncbi:pyruvate ferredoxin oxidoreductase [Anoxybacter fermentans]|uniref:Pyruvate ferredoxin oxidoreductase n=1 Tax=Anoxybacter fermentans TaxID=1323375 RepID=A0A3S9T1B7_9FIRM|nr:transketolase C-terminal domain-containing protein [Anoxybacter fermentans]AZR74406.1 pyruvate ferredoxin oxidoreductase [Anoxybacter fermentans]